VYEIEPLRHDEKKDGGNADSQIAFKSIAESQDTVQSLLVFLNSNFKGGNIEFPLKDGGHRVAPVQGKGVLLTFNLNDFNNDDLQYHHMHPSGPNEQWVLRINVNSENNVNWINLGSLSPLTDEHSLEDQEPFNLSSLF